MYSSIDPADSLFAVLDATGHFEAVATEAGVTHFVSNPPEDTQAWTRAMSLRAAGPDRVSKVDWDRIDLRARGVFPRPVKIHLPDPLGSTCSDMQAIFSEAAELTNLLGGLQDNGIVVHIDNPYSRGCTAGDQMP